MLLLIWLLTLAAAVTLYCRKVYSRFSKYGVKNLPPVPFFGDTMRIAFRLENFFENVERIYNSFPGERFVGNFEFTKPVVFIRDVELIKRITVKDFEHFLDHSVKIDEEIDPLFGKNLFSLKGQKWKDMRSTMSPAFTSSKMRKMIPFMLEAGDQMIIRIKKNIRDSGKNYYDVDFKDISTHYTHDVIASCAFGLKVDSQNESNTKFYEIGKEASQFRFNQVLKFLGYQIFPSVMRLFKINMFSQSSQDFFRNLVTQTMREREIHNIYRPDMIHLLMEAKKGKLLHEEDQGSIADAGIATVEESHVGKKTTNRVWSDDDLIAQAVIFFAAGFEGVAAAATFLIFELALNPEVQEKLAQEIRENDRKTGGKFDYDSIQQMTYMDMVVSESLRLWTPGSALDRICTKDYNLGKPNDDASEDYIIRKGESLKIAMWAIHRDPQFFPNPHKFDPERFSEENRHSINPFLYSPFGIGPRNCIASRFALCETKVMVYQLLRHFEVSLCERSRVPIQLSTQTFMILMKGGHWIRLKDREQGKI